MVSDDVSSTKHVCCRPPYLKVAHKAAHGVVEICAVYIHAETALVATGKAHLAEPQAIIVVIIYPKGVCRRWHGTETVSIDTVSLEKLRIDDGLVVNESLSSHEANTTKTNMI